MDVTREKFKEYVEQEAKLRRANYDLKTMEVISGMWKTGCKHLHHKNESLQTEIKDLKDGITKYLIHKSDISGLQNLITKS